MATAPANVLTEGGWRSSDSEPPVVNKLGARLHLDPSHPHRRRRFAATWCVLATFWIASGPLAVAGPTGDPAAEHVERIATWPSWLGGGRPLFNRSTVPSVPCTPHPAVARIIVPEDGATAYGSGTLVDVREEFGLVITNWHVVRDCQGTVEVVFPGGFRSHARPLKVDSDWDLAALVIWRPPIEPVRVSATPPQPGDPLTIHGYGQGQYRIATGRCTAYYAPKLNYPREMVELDVEARQGDSGGPIFNQRGELAGVLFGAGQGTTIGSFAPRVESFLVSLAPDIGIPQADAQIAIADRAAPAVHPRDSAAGLVTSVTRETDVTTQTESWPSSPWNAPARKSGNQKEANRTEPTQVTASDAHWFDRTKSVLAMVGLLAVALQLIRLAK